VNSEKKVNRDVGAGLVPALYIPDFEFKKRKHLFPFKTSTKAAFMFDIISISQILLWWRF
jgi:hypothetical protein